MNKKLALIFALAVVCQSAFAVTITQWDFNSNPSDANTSTGTTTPAIGLGTASLLGVTGSFSSGDANGGSTDPNVGDDSGWQTTGYAAQNTASGTRGVQFLSSTVGFNNIVVSWDCRHSNTSSRYTQLDYTLDGGTSWTAFMTHDANLGGDTWYNGITANLSSVTGAANNADFGVRIVSVFAPTGGGYVATTSTATYATTGTLRYDMVNVSGQAVPEPASLAALGIGVAALIRRRRTR
ncbi:MAG: PEP-CTERM sorting domain-containing protein [Fimbriimonadaceae bacterium]